jgi:hypothetical protein
MAKVRPKLKKKKAKPLTSAQAEKRRRVLKLTVGGLGIVAAIGVSLIGYDALADHVGTRYTVVDARPAIILSNRPLWMTDAIATDIAQKIAGVIPDRSSTLDHKLLVSIHDILRNDAWIQKVEQVRRVQVDGQDTLIIGCHYRTPQAIVHWEDASGASYRLVAHDSVLLPPTYTWDQVRPILVGQGTGSNLRVLVGILKGPPDKAGETWIGEDLSAGLDVAGLLHELPTTRDITIIDVTNVAERARRGQPQIVLRTKHDTEIWWGRPPQSNDFLVEPTPNEKLAVLAEAARRFKGQYPQRIDLRRDGGSFSLAE